MKKLSSLRRRLKKANEMLSHNVFDAYDYNQDQLIGRDEWEGNDEVFSLLDQNQDEYLDSGEASWGVVNNFSKMAEENEYLTPEQIAKIMGGTLIK